MAARAGGVGVGVLLLLHLVRPPLHQALLLLLGVHDDEDADVESNEVVDRPVLSVYVVWLEWVCV